MEDHPKIRMTSSDELLLNFGEYGQKIEIAAFSGDGRRLLTVRDVGVAQIWHTESSALLQEIRPTSPLDGTDAAPMAGPFRTFIEAASLNGDGSLALLGLNDGSAGVFSVATGERLSRMKESLVEDVGLKRALAPDQWELVRAVCFSPDGSLVAIGHYDRTVSIWDSTSGRSLHYLRPESSERYVRQGAWGRDTLVSAVGISADNRFCFSFDREWKYGTGWRIGCW